LTIDNGGINKEPTILPSLGKGIAQSGTSGATLVTDRATNIQAFYVGHWVEITAPDGMLKGTWRIATIDAAKTVTLTPNDAEAIAIDPGDTWQGVYRFDNVKAVGIRVDSADPIRVTGTQTIEGTVETERITAGTLVVKGTLTHAVSQSLIIDADDVIVEAGGAIDATGKGYVNGEHYPGEGIAGSWSGTSHIGQGGLYTAPFGSTYGSIYRPREPGASTRPAPFGAGGGVVRIDASTVLVDGSIRANGAQHDHSGAGGSVWITTGRISGTGAVETNGGPGRWGIGGGGALAIEYTDPTSVLPTLSSRTGTNTGESRYGGAGSIYVMGPTSIYGDLRIDNGGLAVRPTILPSLGEGTAQAGSSGATLVTDRTTDIQPFYIGHWVEVRAADSTLKGIWRIGSVIAKTATLVPNASESIDVAVGDLWKGIYRIDTLTLRGATLTSADRLDYTTLDKDGTSTLSAMAGSDAASDMSADLPSGAASGPSVTPPVVALASIELEPVSLEGRGTVNAFVTLTAPAPPGGALVLLTSSNVAAIVPEAVVIPAGATGASFTIATVPVAEPVTVTITATWGTSSSAQLTVREAAR
jgi:hypothetical protein